MVKRVRTEQDRIAGQLYRAAHREAINARIKAWNKQNPERRREIERRSKLKYATKIREQKQAWAKTHRIEHNEANARWKINRMMPIVDFNAMMTKQGGKCAICLAPGPGNKKHGHLCIDHDHVSGRVRGLLCHCCNSLLGHAKDNTATLKAAIVYLENRA